MPRLSQSVPKYRKHKASGQAIVEINGRRHYLGPHGSKASKLEYDRLITEWLTSGRSPTYGVPEQATTITELVVAYLEHAKAYYGAGHSEYQNLVCALRPLRLLYGTTEARRFMPRQLKTVREKLIADNKSRPYINATIRRIVRAFRWAVAEGLIPPDVPQALAMVPGLRRGKTDARETEPVRPVDDALVEATLPYLPEVVADMVRVQRLTGCRPAEVCTMRPADIKRDGEVWEYRPATHKTAHHGKERVIFIGPQAQGVLFKYLARDAEAHCFSPTDSEKKRLAARHEARVTPLSCGNRPGTNRVKHNRRRPPGEQYDVDSYRRAIHRACEKAGVAHWSPNQLRHAAATEIRRRFGLEAAQVALGHSKADVTQVYAERDWQLAARVAKEVG